VPSSLSNIQKESKNLNFIKYDETHWLNLDQVVSLRLDKPGNGQTRSLLACFNYSDADGPAYTVIKAGIAIDIILKAITPPKYGSEDC
jgi:hypothetical protein